MALAAGNIDHILAVAADVLYLFQGAARRHEAERAALDLLQRLVPQGKAEAIHRHHGKAAVVDLKQGAGMDGAALVGGDGEGRLADHGLQRFLLYGDAVLVVHLRQLGVIVGGQAQNVKAGVAAAEVHHQLFVRREYNHIIRHTANNVAKQAGIQYDAALLPHVGLQPCADTSLCVVARQGKAVAALQRRDGAFRGNGAAGGGRRRLQQRFFAGEFQHR